MKTLHPIFKPYVDRIFANVPPLAKIVKEMAERDSKVRDET